jgi:hypothetical protein
MKYWVFSSEPAAKQLNPFDRSKEEIVDYIHAFLQEELQEGLTEFFTTLKISGYPFDNV